MDTTEIVVPYGADGASVSEQKYRDVLKLLHAMTDGEVLSGFWRTGCFIPAITLVIYFGLDDWDAPLSLKEMYSNTNSVLLAHAPDYHVNLIAPKELSDEEINEFHSNLR